MKGRTVKLAPVFSQCELQAATADESARSVELTFYSGAIVNRLPLFGEPYELVFETTRKAAKLERLNAGAPLIDSHRTEDGVRAQLGVVEKAWFDGNRFRARVRFSKRDDVEPIWQDVLDGVVRNVSMGTYILEMEDATAKGAEIKRVRATSWEPYELSLTPIGADPGAQIGLSADAETHPCRFKGGNVMRKLKKCPACKAQLKHEPDVELTECPECEVDLAEAEAERDELVRVGHADRIARFFELDEVTRARWIRDKLSREDMQHEGARIRADRQPIIHGGCSLDFDSDPRARFDAMAAALAARAMHREPEPFAQRYFGASPADIALEVLRASGRVEYRILDPRRNASRIIELTHTTSDFLVILGNAVNRMLQPEYEQAPATYRSICAKREFRDFRPHTWVRLGDFPDLKEVGEAGEIQHGTISESGETVTAANYARIFSISRKALVNDDVGAFNDLVMKAARRVAGFENSLFFTILQSNSGNGPTMSDTKSLFHADHGNTGTGTIDVTNVGAGVAKMMKQTGLDAVKLNIEPALLVVSPDRVAVARQFVTQNLRPTQPSEAQPFANLTALADANLTSAAPWFLFAAPGVNASFVYGYLEGSNGPRVDTRAGWEVEGLQVRCSLDFAVGATDWRGAFRSTGS